MERYIPDIYQKSIYTIDYSKLLSRGIKCLLFDLDNTLVGYKEKEPNKAKNLIISLKQKGFKVIIFSNSPKFKAKKYRDFFDVDCIHLALKPFQGKFKKILKDYKFTINEIAIIGDQILTDVVGGNKLGVTTILVNPITEKDSFPTNIVRKFEKRKKKKLRKNNLFYEGRYYD